jgi:hypothetical protein
MHRDTPRPVAAYLDSGKSIPTTTNGGFETPMCPIGGSAPKRDTLQEVARVAVLRRPVHPVVEFSLGRRGPIKECRPHSTTTSFRGTG